MYLLCRHTIKENEAKIQLLTLDLRKISEERNELRVLVSQHQEIHETVQREGENRAAALEVGKTLFD